MHLVIFSLAIVLLSVMTPGVAKPSSAFNHFKVIGTVIQLKGPDGQILSEDELIGAEISLGDASAHELTLRIDGIEHDANDSELVFYNFSARLSESEPWRPVCQPDYDGKTLGYLLEAVTTATGEYIPAEGVYSLQCTSGASGKCVRLGYKPWGLGPDGQSLWNHHQTCTRIVRGDYCGDGVAHTKNGTTINIYDLLDIQISETSPEFTFEAAWGTEGAICVRKVRWPDIFSLELLATSCPKLKNRLGALCSEETAAQFGSVLIFNESKSPFLEFH